MARQARATPPQPAPAPGPSLKLQLEQTLREGGGVGLLPSPFPVAPLPRRQLGLGHWSPVPPLTGTDSHLVPLSTRVPSIPLPSVSLSWTKQCCTQDRDSRCNSRRDWSPREGRCTRSGPGLFPGSTAKKPDNLLPTPSP